MPRLTEVLTSEVVTGTAPFVIASTTLVTNLNADLLDGYHASGLSGLIDHGTTTGLSDDDHTQYARLDQTSAQTIGATGARLTKLWATDITVTNAITGSITGSAASLSISGQTGLLTFTGLASTNRIKTIRDAADTILELGGSYTPSATWDWTSASVTWPTFNQNTTGSAAKWTTARTLAGNSVDGSANVAFSNSFIARGTADTGLSGAQFLGSLGTGIVKNTTTTGDLSIAINSDLPAMTATVGGAVPTPPNNTTTFLRGDGTFAAPTASIAIGGTVTSGTTGSVLFVGSGPVLAQDNASLFFDDTNNRLGISTTAPTSQLMIVGSGLTGTARGITLNQYDSSPSNAAVIFLQHSRGTPGSESAVLSGDILGNVAYGGWNGSAFDTGVLTRGLAAENWSATNEGTDFDVRTIPIASITPQTRFLVTANGNIVLGSQAALATNATDGFAYVSSQAGTPTGTPTSYTGKIPVTYDSTNNLLYAYSNAAWRTAGAGTPTAITVANEATDTTCFPAFFTAATGDLGPKTNANLTYNSNTGAFVATTYSGLTLTANADGAQVAGGTTSRTLKWSGAAITIVGSGTATITFPTSTSTLSTLALSETLTNKTLTTPVIASTGFTNAQHAHVGPTSGGGIGQYLQLTGDVASTSNVLADTTGLASFTLAASSTYYFKFHLLVSTNATTTGILCSINASAAVTSINFITKWPTSATAYTTARQTALQGGTQPTAGPGATTRDYLLEGFVVTSGAVTLALQHCTEVNTTTTATVEAGSFGYIVQVPT